MPMLKKLTILAVAGVLGAGAALGVAACGEDREGDVEFEGGTATTGGSTAGTETTPAATETEVETETEMEMETETETETESGSDGGATAP